MLSRTSYRLFAYFRHRFRSLISSKGYGIHSPFAFALVTDLINNNDVAYYAFDCIEKQRHHCLNDSTKITLMNGKTQTIASLCKRSSSPDKDAQLLFKLAVLMKSNTVIELGTFLGFGTAYLASISSQAKVISIDHDPTSLSYANKNLKALGIANVELMEDTIDNALPHALAKVKQVDFIFFDGHHTREATLHYFSLALPYVSERTVFVFHDIHWSKGMYQAWQTISNHPKVSLSIERYNMGLIFFDPQYQKLHYYA